MRITASHYKQCAHSDLVVRTRKDAILPFSEPIQGVNGEILTEVLVPKDTTITVGVRACNRNKAIWGDDALEWKSERWLNPLPESVGQARVPGIYANL